MIATNATPMLGDAQQVLTSAVAHQLERMTKEEVQALAANALLACQNENAALRTRIEQLAAQAAESARTIDKLEADKVRLYYKIGRLQFSEKDWQDFDPNEYTVPVAELLADMDKILNESAGSSHG